MDYPIKTITISSRETEPQSDIFWEARIYPLPDHKYQAQLWVYDEYDGYLVRWKPYKDSQAFDSVAEAERYIAENWLDADPRFLLSL